MSSTLVIDVIEKGVQHVSGDVPTLSRQKDVKCNDYVVSPTCNFLPKCMAVEIPKVYLLHSGMYGF